MSEHAFIVGTTHSGTTVLYRLLAYHPEFAWFSQFSMRDGSVPGQRALPMAGVYDRLVRRVSRHPWTKNTHAGFVGAVRARVVPSPSEGIPMWEYALPDHRNVFYGVSDVPRVRARVEEVVQRALRAEGKQRLLVKIPRLAQSVPALAELFPRARFIHMIRDGKAVSVSPVVEPRGSEESLARIRVRATKWRENAEWMREMERRLGSGRVRTVRYEDMCADLHGVTRSLWAWCGLAAPERVLDGVPPSIVPTNGRQFDRTLPAEREVIMDTLADALPEFGYQGYQGDAAAAA